MSKRCCAKNCFNSVLYNKNIAYFSFPKNKKFAQQWAELAGRIDLKEKPLSRLVKYYLCSEHFTGNCFIDKETRQTLKRNLPHSIALPSIFKNNLQETMQHANPRKSIEVHNIILLDVDDRFRKNCQDNNDNNCRSVTERCVEKYASPLKTDLYEYDNFKHDYMDICTDMSNNDEQTESICRSYIEEEPPMHCRLCCTELKTEDSKINFNDSEHLKEFIDRVMQDRISIRDGLSQVVCKNCENNALLCLIIIRQMDKAQEKSVTNGDG